MRTDMSGFKIFAGVIALAFVVGGCSFSKSSESISKSISSPSVSISKSSNSEDKYAGEVRDFTAAHVRSGGTAADLKTRVGELAEKEGVSDWERDDRTWQAIGAGLAKAGYSKVELDAYVANLAPDADQHKWLQKGYNSYKP